MEFTDDQKKVIDTRKKNILVSAAAGSGKTAVLVERIISLITSEDDPLDLDSLLVVTFTRAAAAQMKDRIGKALLELVSSGHVEFEKQLTLIHNARITTIDGFCRYLIENYGNNIGLESGIKIADPGEAKLIEKDTYKEFIEEQYNEASPEFLAFTETFATNKNDSVIEELIMRLAAEASSMPDPAKWLDGLSAKIDEESVSPENSEWMTALGRDISSNLKFFRDNIKTAIGLSEGIFDKYIPLLRSEDEYIARLEEASSDYEKMRELLFGDFAFQRMPSYKKGIDDITKNKISDIRTSYKNYIEKELMAKLYFLPYDDLLATGRKAGAPLKEFVRLTKAYMEKYSLAKQRRGIMDFSDLEHFALKILKDDSGNVTEAAMELSERFKAVMVDEYQDSNFLQEEILTAVCSNDPDEPDYFTVGDVKQSIYGFRQARPELFLHKYEQYPSDEKSVRIDLHENFRSRRQIIGSVNDIFSKIMLKEIGGIAYDDDAMLRFGATESFPDDGPAELGCDFRTEFIPVFTKPDPEEKELSGRNRKELEARAVGTRILSLLKNGYIYDEEFKEYRNVKLRDIVILLRNMTDGEVFISVLKDMGIPSAAVKSTGYFSADEVRTVLNYLTILDNPRQDIPLASVLTSRMASFKASELAVITAAGDEKCFRLWDRVRYYAEHGEDYALKQKVISFLETYEELLDRSSYVSINRLIWDLVSQTGYLTYISTLTDSQQKLANVNMLMEKAASYETGSYSGLFNFIRYIENLKKYEVDFDEAGVYGENEDIVTITTIHKSKGLEYPIVFVSELSRKFNTKDLDRPILSHVEYGLASDYIDYERRVSVPCLKKYVIRSAATANAAGEELRVLYVAMTRAKQKLILTGTVKDQEKLDDLLAKGSGNALSPVYIKNAQSFSDLILPAFGSSGDNDNMRIYYLTPADISEIEVRRQSEKANLLSIIDSIDPGKVYDEEIFGIVNERFNYIYPYEVLSDLPSKVTVSEIKSAANSSFDGAEKYEEPEIIPYIPDFVAGAEEPHKGAYRGTIYHRILQLWDYQSEAPVKDNIGDMVSRGFITEEEAKLVSPYDIEQFLGSSLGLRMKKASLCGQLHRESPFVITKQASEIDGDWPQDETVLVQGVIDVWFTEDDKLILADYKTDRVRTKDGSDLMDKYRIQLLTYADALSRLLDRKVDEAYIYSFALDKTIQCDLTT